MTLGVRTWTKALQPFDASFSGIHDGQRLLLNRIYTRRESGVWYTYQHSMTSGSIFGFAEDPMYVQI